MNIENLNKTTKKGTKKMNIENLKYNFVNAQSTDFDWSQGSCETWEIEYPNHENTTGRELVALRDEYMIDKDSYNDENQLRELITEYQWENGYCDPMMNYFTPVPDHTEVDADMFNGSCFTLINFIESDTQGLALTGGGMDMRWDMCEAFVNAGFAPPAYIANLPAMAGRGQSENDKKLIKACNKSLQSLVDRYTRDIEANNQLTERG